MGFLLACSIFRFSYSFPVRLTLKNIQISLSWAQEHSSVGNKDDVQHYLLLKNIFVCF